jgi:hypothetical protein
MKILSFVRAPQKVEVAIKRDGKIEALTFPKSMTDAEVYAAVKGKPAAPVVAPEPPPAGDENKAEQNAPTIPEPPPAGDENKAEQNAPTIPEPPENPPAPLTIKQMVSELEKAGITSGYDKSKLFSVKSAYEKMKTAEAATE